MKWISLIVLFLSGCAALSERPGQVEISGLTQGLMRQEAGGVWKVYEQGADFPYQANGQCVANNTRKACMWFGIEFDFRSPAGTAVLDCVARLSRPTDVVTPGREEARQVTEFRYPFILEGRSGHSANPGNAILAGNDPPADMKVECSHGGRVVLRYAFAIHSH